MRLFQCQCCCQVLHFENTVCLRCNRTVGYLPRTDRMVAVEADGPAWFVTETNGGEPDTQRWRFCRNWELSACNWMVPVTDAEAGAEAEFCVACRHNRTIPDLSDPVNHGRWLRIEAAKRRLIYTLRRMGLPCPALGDDHPQPMIFDFLADDPNTDRKVMTGHANGVITLSLTEADDAAREQIRSDMGEAYRTLLGHFRHEIGHYYWDLLIRDGGAQDSFRQLFGDERQDYAEALDRHYHEGASDGWQDAYVSAYATMHPWEDWAETWAHYLHMIDTLETAAALGIRVGPPVDSDGDLSAQIHFDPYAPQSMELLMGAWMPLTVALNTLSRSMGQADMYPFALAEQVQEKFRYVHRIVTARGGLSA